MLRQHVHKAIVDRNVPSIKLVLEEAEKHNELAMNHRYVAPTSPGHAVTFISAWLRSD